MLEERSIGIASHVMSIVIQATLAKQGDNYLTYLLLHTPAHNSTKGEQPAWPLGGGGKKIKKLDFELAN